MKYVVSIMLLLFCIQLSADIMDGLVLNYPFNGNANDESGNNHHGTINGPTPTFDRFGNDDSAYFFDGEDNTDIDCGNSLAEIFESDTFSISIWMNRLSGYGCIITSGGPGFLNFYLRNEVLHMDNDGNLQYPELSTDRWHHLCLVMDDGEVTIYTNTLEAASQESMTCGDHNDGVLLIGNSYGGSYPFYGRIDDVRIYDRALSESEIGDLYHENGWVSTPQNVVMFLNGEQFQMSWDPVPGAAYYNIYSGNDPYGLLDQIVYADTFNTYSIPQSFDSRFFQATTQALQDVIINFVDPEPGDFSYYWDGSTYVLHYNGPVLPATYDIEVTTPNPNMQSASFYLLTHYYDDDGDCCNGGNDCFLLGTATTPGNTFHCNADFTQLGFDCDSYFCLRVDLSDNSENIYRKTIQTAVDNMLPGQIDLSAYPHTTDSSRIVLHWIEPGDNGFDGWQELTSRDIRVSTSPILTLFDFNQAGAACGDYWQHRIGSPGQSLSCTIYGVNYTYFPQGLTDLVYYFAIKATDEAGNYSLSNCASSILPYHDLVLHDSLTCINLKDSLDANYEYHTNYLYDTLQFCGWVTNNGNLDENWTIELMKSLNTVNSCNFNVMPDSIMSIALNWVADCTARPLFQVYFQYYINPLVYFTDWYSIAKIMSISEWAEIEWYDDDQYPAPEEPAGELFYVGVFVTNTNDVWLDYYDFPVHIDINTDFSVESFGYYGGDFSYI